MFLYSFGNNEVGSSNLGEEKNRENHRGDLETPSVRDRRPVSSASTRLRKERERFRRKIVH